MIDLHILTHEGTRADWLEQAIASTVGQGVTVHLIDNAGKSVGQGRAVGYQQGEHEFVAYLDSDDYLLPGCMDACREGLKEHRAVVTMERVVYESGRVFPFPKPGHSIAVYRREDVTPWLDALAGSHHSADMNLRRVLRPTQISFLGYVWRVHQGGDHHRTMAALPRESLLWPTDY